MAEYRLKVKIGDHEFEADGPADVVKSQFEAFKELIAVIPIHKPENTDVTPVAAPATNANPVANGNPSIPLNVDRIFRADNRIISLTAPPSSETDAVLLVLYGQRHYRNNENATGSEIIDGMVQSGYRTPRIDRILSSLADEGAVIVTGAHRGKRYRLTNQGHTRAENVVRETLARLP
ncbi:MAG TPA: hypothetical protein VI636_15020 [Candidatus Angelobacter sp.]